MEIKSFDFFYSIEQGQNSYTKELDKKTAEKVIIFNSLPTYSDKSPQIGPRIEVKPIGAFYYQGNWI